MVIKIKESEMVDFFIRHYQDGVNYYREVPVFAKSVDLVKINKSDNSITAIEFKKTKWKKAEMQALGSAIVFDYLEICILKPATTSCQTLIINECQKQGLGLYFMDANKALIEHIVYPIPRDEVWGIQRKQICDYLSKRGHE
jgi:hypothetical protein